ncbi:MAG: chemotaxis protein CheD [Dehalococcoidia bacterium]|nr:chemotaxis protein CheD [Dehalococcoidia bacterium]
MDVQKTLAVGMGEICTARDPLVVLAAYGLGSCVGVSVYDPVAKVGGLAHVMLPSSREVSLQKLSYRFADVAVPALLEQVQKLGAIRKRLICKIAGGARMFAMLGSSDGFKIGGAQCRGCGGSPGAMRNKAASRRGRRFTWENSEAPRGYWAGLR